MKKVIEEKVFLSNNAKDLFSEIDFSDTFSTTNHCNTIDEVAKLIFSIYPKWIEYLFQLRNSLMGVFGLQTAIPKSTDGEEYHGFFKVYKSSKNELVLGADDKHLNFRAVLTNTQEQHFNIKLTTLVFYNNTFGKIYMTLIGPFHRIVVKRMVKQAFCVR